MPSKELLEQSASTKIVTNKSKNNDDNSEPSILWSKITLEPMWIGVTISFSTALFAYKNLFVQRACLIDLGYPEEVCFSTDSNTKKVFEIKAQQIVSSYMITSTFITGLITCILFLFMGPWSDNSGRRKPLLLLSITGMMVSSSTLVIIQFLPTIPTVWIIYAEVIPLAIGGNYTLLIMSSMSYLGDICFKTGRCATTMIGKNLSALGLCMMIGCLVSPVIYRNYGFTAIFSFCFVLELTSLIYVIYRVKDINIADKIPSIFDITLPLQAFRAVFKKREGNKRKNILLMIIVPCCGTMIDGTEISLYYLYLRNKFSWTELEYGYFMTLRMIIFTLGNVLIISVLKVKLEDRYIGIISGLSQICSSLIFIFSNNIWGILSSGIVALFSRGAVIMERPIINKQITANEQGKINSLTAVFERSTSFIYGPLATFIYSKTLDTFPTAFATICIIGAVIQILCFVLLSNEKVEDRIDMKKKEVI
ncbi:putative peptidoglycan muropeptide transporter SLC46 [Arctopsyche grandis]|uniref:putative peptidoglycan muropeptide transporter SLC46 n=1 Tax=Arctopsyche grandis TaxID=121162 RepID=UPI00406D9121